MEVPDALRRTASSGRGGCAVSRRVHRQRPGRIGPSPPAAASGGRADDALLARAFGQPAASSSQPGGGPESARRRRPLPAPPRAKGFGGGGGGGSSRGGGGGRPPSGEDGSPAGPEAPVQSSSKPTFLDSLTPEKRAAFASAGAAVFKRLQKMRRTVPYAARIDWLPVPPDVLPGAGGRKPVSVIEYRMMLSEAFVEAGIVAKDVPPETDDGSDEDAEQLLGQQPPAAGAAGGGGGGGNGSPLANLGAALGSLLASAFGGASGGAEADGGFGEKWNARTREEAAATLRRFTMHLAEASLTMKSKAATDISQATLERLRAWLDARLEEPTELNAITRAHAADYDASGWAAAAPLWPSGEESLRRTLAEAAAAAAASAPPARAAAAGGGLVGHEAMLHIAREAFLSDPRFSSIPPEDMLDAGTEMAGVFTNIIWQAGLSENPEALGFALIDTVCDIGLRKGDPRELGGFVAAFRQGGLTSMCQSIHADFIGQRADIGLGTALQLLDKNAPAAAPAKAKGFSAASRAAAEDKAPVLAAELDAFDLEELLRWELRATAADRFRARARLWACVTASYGVTIAVKSLDRRVASRDEIALQSHSFVLASAPRPLPLPAIMVASPHETTAPHFFPCGDIHTGGRTPGVVPAAARSPRRSGAATW